MGIRPGDHGGRAARLWTAGVAALPGLILAGFSLIHPPFLAPATASAWWHLHIPLIPVFPLLGGAVLVVLHTERGVLAALARAGAYLYACLYTALDTISGIAAGIVTERLGDTPAVPALFAVGDGLGRIGIGCLAVASILAALVLARTARARVLPGAVVTLAACWGFAVHHVFVPWGTVSMLGFAVGFALLGACRSATRRDASGMA